MAITTYSGLKTSIANYLARSDLTTQIPDFIRLAEVRMRRELRLRQMLKLSTASMTGGDSTVGTPGDLLQVRDLSINTDPKRALNYLSPSTFSRNGRTNESGLPVFYTTIANEFRFAPIPDTNYTIEMLYYAAPDFLSDSNPSNTFLSIAPDMLLYGALVEAEPYLMNDARIQLWAGLYDRALKTISEADEGAEYSGVPLAMTVTAR